MNLQEAQEQLRAGILITTDEVEVGEYWFFAEESLEVFFHTSSHGDIEDTELLLGSNTEYEIYDESAVDDLPMCENCGGELTEDIAEPDLMLFDGKTITLTMLSVTYCGECGMIADVTDMTDYEDKLSYGVNPPQSEEAK